ncbi:hypothetical protein ABEY24_06240 [Peribacillus frigoritolerans]|uniref:hypothetical protein n=1 Tax=Peribacillus frigoritolerans TaxID=450367 RepID=UPI003D29B713
MARKLQYIKLSIAEIDDWLGLHVSNYCMHSHVSKAILVNGIVLRKTSRGE